MLTVFNLPISPEMLFILREIDWMYNKNEDENEQEKLCGLLTAFMSSTEVQKFLFMNQGNG